MIELLVYTVIGTVIWLMAVINRGYVGTLPPLKEKWMVFALLCGPMTWVFLILILLSKIFNMCHFGKFAKWLDK